MSTPPKVPPPPRRRSVVRRLLAVTIALAGALLLAEGLIRVRHWWKYGSFGEIYTFRVDEASGLSVPPAGRNGSIEIDSRGFRNPELVMPKPAGALRLGFLGGSTTYCAEASGNDKTWPALVAAAVAKARPDRAVDFVNAAVGGYSIEHSVRNYRHRLAAMEPDVVVIYHLINDLTKDTGESAKAAGIWKGPSKDWLEDHSMLWSIVKKNVLLKLRAEGNAAEQATKLEYDAESGAKRFEERLVALIEDVKQATPVVAVATFAHRVRAEQDQAARQEACKSSFYYMPFMTADGILEGVAAYNAAIRRAAQRTGALLIEGEERIPADAEHYNDSVHFRDAGCAAMAARVSEVLLRDGVLPKTGR
jgi:lysophospholipase L1-like esterase